MKKVFIAIFMFLPMMMSAQSTLTPQQQLEQAQKQLEEAKKAVEAAKQAAEKAKKQADEAAKAAAEKAQIEKQTEAVKLPAIGGKPVVVGEPEEKATDQKAASNNGWVVPTTPTTTTKKEVKETPKLASGVTLKEDPKYLEGAISLNKDGKVEFELDMDANGKTAEQIYQIVYNYLTELTQDKNNIASRVALVNPDEHVIANTMDEWLVFSQSFISLDRCEFKYQLVARISNNHLNLQMTRLFYNYEEGRSTGFKDAAENVITDKIALTKKKNDLAKMFGKFRKRTIDRKDQIFSEIAELVKK